MFIAIHVVIFNKNVRKNVKNFGSNLRNAEYSDKKKNIRLIQ